ncbi:SAM-dependent methyltransferase [Heyndrickxia sporothermodurans]|uniref:class I SAM-dependent methyltransferase n=1 Tax=Heyndrickxia TaxID=2837504 RepID=UPI000D3C4A88|nr:class I SAM-dependent methyltransferase [Heyndrickxia sporothermodurans]PTY76893.1 SAM-dependent methyltransferase [Heyndrickxia sporothermodurans]
MNKQVLETIVDCMAANIEMRDIQRIQTKHRMKLVEFWEIEKGDKVLEIGCGQGDTTAVLAYYVGESGLVQGVDIGSESYGSPVSLGDSAMYLTHSKLGKQINMNFNVDILSPEIDFPDGYFDCIVLSHCSWYLKSKKELFEILSKIKKWGKKLCFAEWDTNIHKIEQYSHFLSILIQAQLESFKDNSESNVRTLFTPNEIIKIAKHAGWTITNETSIFSPDIQDGQWEIHNVLTEFDEELQKNGELPIKLKELLQSEKNMLEEHIKVNKIIPLSVYAFTAN